MLISRHLPRLQARFLSPPESRFLVWPLQSSISFLSPVSQRWCAAVCSDACAVLCCFLFHQSLFLVRICMFSLFFAFEDLSPLISCFGGFTSFLYFPKCISPSFALCHLHSLARWCVWWGVPSHLPIRASLNEVSSLSLPPAISWQSEQRRRGGCFPRAALQSQGPPAPQCPSVRGEAGEQGKHIWHWEQLPAAGEAATALCHLWRSSFLSTIMMFAELFPHSWLVLPFISEVTKLQPSETRQQVCTTTSQCLDLGSELRRVLAWLTRGEKCFLSVPANNQVILTSKIWLGYWLGKSKPGVWSLLCQQNRLAWVWCSAFNKELLIE